MSLMATIALFHFRFYDLIKLYKLALYGSFIQANAEIYKFPRTPGEVFRRDRLTKV